MKITRTRIEDSTGVQIEWNFEVDGEKWERTILDFQDSRKLTNTDAETGYGVFRSSAAPTSFARGRMEIEVEFGELPSEDASSEKWVNCIKSRVEMVNAAFEAKYPRTVDTATVEF
jgi:hypothetical protein